MFFCVDFIGTGIKRLFDISQQVESIPGFQWLEMSDPKHERKRFAWIVFQSSADIESISNSLNDKRVDYNNSYF